MLSPRGAGRPAPVSIRERAIEAGTGRSVGQKRARGDAVPRAPSGLPVGLTPRGRCLHLTWRGRGHGNRCVNALVNAAFGHAQRQNRNKSRRDAAPPTPAPHLGFLTSRQARGRQHPRLLSCRVGGGCAPAPSCPRAAGGPCCVLPPPPPLLSARLSFPGTSFMDFGPAQVIQGDL